MMFARALAALVLTASILAAETSSAQTYPSHPITLVAPFPPGGATDTIARIMQDSMSKSLGQQMIIENVSPTLQRASQTRREVQRTFPIAHPDQIRRD
jgi:tripartite-type tricarboxylate transporter receptor subunit TctC